jgi:hypothetical protein
MTTGRSSKNKTVITAAEIGEYAYCAKAWRLKRDGVAPRGSQLGAGTAFHHQHGEMVTDAAHWERQGRRVAGLAFLLLLLLAFYLWLTGGAR